MSQQRRISARDRRHQAPTMASIQPGSPASYPRLHLLNMPLEVRLKIFHELWQDRDFDLLMFIKDYEDRHDNDNPITLASIHFIHFNKLPRVHWHNKKIPWDRYASCLSNVEFLWFNRRLRGHMMYSNRNYFHVFNLMMSCRQLWEEGSLAYWRQKRLQIAITKEFGEIPRGDEEIFAMPQSTNSILLGGSIGNSVRILTLRFDDKVLNCRVTRCDTVPGITTCARHADETFMPKLQWAHDTIMKALRLFTSVTCLELLIENERVFKLYDSRGTFAEILNFVKEERPLIKVVRIKGGPCAEMVKQWNLKLDASVSGIAWSMNPCVPTCKDKKYSAHVDKFDATPREVDQRPDFA
ncbi:uncharacterized protein TRIREDRAFT_122147 [Trichoderma reesei QM6a]|uniref:Predicted protein n=1 Tax=Hypocrea jecorina (strain QM6a) TaxID=431241 RepID=G0RK68_HYPJQ|nr:uncharacterized protein TRIREDRAFT_122147 [Trichoderma reesei QM6a]EGR48319.1 predicted protein [Trichoderma reesei QM6a]